MICSICNKPFATNETIIRGVVCKILDIHIEEIECMGDIPVLDMHMHCFEQQAKERGVDVVEVTTSVERNDAFGCFV